MNFFKQKLKASLVNRDPINQLVLFISSLACLAVIPLFCIRALDQNWPMVLIDATLVVVLFAIAITAYKAKHANMARIALGVVFVGGMLATTVFGSASSVFWIYPSVIAVFLLFQPKWALLSTLCVCFVIFPFLNARMVEKDWLIFYVTLLPTIVFIYYFSTALRRQTLELKTLAEQDYLTKAGNRRSFNLKAESCIQSKLISNQNSILILFDMDNFKHLNDNHGHVVGDAVLKNVTSVVGQCLRNTDQLYRLGGEEFAIIVHSARVDEAMAVAEKIRQAIIVHQNDQLPKYTVSFGVAEVQKADSVEAWMNRADKALYHSKQNGRDQVNCA